LANRFGKVIAREAKECNLGIWLAPALNIHRHPRCGRKFEYYSEDPLTSGLFAAAVVSGVQSQKIAATVKHFCCNNREYYRRIADSRVSQRALREIYLKGFEICIQKSNPWCLMTSYNLTNGEQGSTNREAINGILRGEWGYDGVVMTDWRTYSLLEDEIIAGNDVKMPQRVSTVYEKAPKDIDPGEMIRKGIIPRECAITSVRRILKMMSHLE
jgi:beta-glucosidase